jgi:hypothetical protein
MRARLCAAKTFQYCFAEKYRRHIISNASPSKMRRIAVVMFVAALVRNLPN